jgi:hypothetical protein
MPNFAIRVELRGNPTREQYETLHVLMARKGFLQTVSGVDSQGNQKQVALPHAVYYGASTASCASVRDAVVSAVQSQVQRDMVVFVVQAETWALS